MDYSSVTHPGSYEAVGSKIIGSGFIATSLCEVVNLVCNAFLEETSERSKFRGLMPWIRYSVQTEGLWGFTQTYWANNHFFAKRDIFGVGVKLGLGDPLSADEMCEINGPRDRVFSPQSFRNHPAYFILGNSSEGLIRLAREKRLSIKISGLTPLYDGQIVQGSPSIKIENGLINNSCVTHGGSHLGIGRSVSTLSLVKSKKGS